MTDSYPTAFNDLPVWAATNQLPGIEARTRFAQYGVLAAIASSQALRPLLVFKGGNALDFVWSPNRSTTDLDFSADVASRDERLANERLSKLLTGTLLATGQALNIVYRIHSVRRQPSGSQRTFATIVCRVGYALEDEARLIRRMELGEPSSQVISVEVSLNEVICEATIVAIDQSHQLRIATLNDIVAEKLRALLQQSIRNRHRGQDLLGIATVLASSASQALDSERVSHFLIAKSLPRGIEPTKRAFRDPDIIARARVDYAALEPTTRNQFIDFEAAVGLLTAFVDQLTLPE